MSRWGKNFVVPLDSLIKEKENTNRPTAARSAGTVGKWGKMGFTSTRTYTLQSLATVISPGQSPELTAAVDAPTSPTNEPPKPKKFFKSRNASADLLRAQIQHLPRAPPSPIHESSGSMPTTAHPPGKQAIKEPIKLKISKSPAEKKKPVAIPKVDSPPKSKKKSKSDKKQLKPEAAPSRVTSRNRKVVNYNEDEDDDAVLRSSRAKQTPASEPPAESAEEIDSHELPPPQAVPFKPVDHPPIVLRISKGTSRLISTDSEDQQINSPQHDISSSSQQSPRNAHRVAQIDAVDEKTNTTTTDLNNSASPISANTSTFDSSILSAPEVNYCTVKISPDKPPKERLKLIIKTDVLRNALAAAAAASTSNSTPEKSEKKKSKRHKSVKLAASTETQFKTPSPQPISVENFDNERVITSPPGVPSEKDFDSQSSVLGSVSTKSTNVQQLQQVISEEACVIHSRGSSDITSDVETSQHSSLVAAPSDIETRLEMLDGDADEVDNVQSVEEEPLKEDILQILTGVDEVNEPEESTVKIENKRKTRGKKSAEVVVQKEKQEAPQRRARGQVSPIKKETNKAAISPLKEEEMESPTRRSSRRTAAVTSAVGNEAVEEKKAVKMIIKKPETTGKRGGRRAQVVAESKEVEDEEMAEEIEEQETEVIEVASKRVRRGQAIVEPAKVVEEVKTPPKRGRKRTQPTQEPVEAPINEEPKTEESPIKKGGRRAKQAAATVAKEVVKETTPEKIAEEEPDTEVNTVSNKRGGRKAQATVSESPEEVEPLGRRRGRAPRIVNNNNTRNLKAEEPTSSTTDIESPSSAPVVRSYGRKRKNPAKSEESPSKQPALEEESSGPAPSASIDLPDESAPYTDVASPMPMDFQTENTTVPEPDPEHERVEVPKSPPKEYKIKNKFKRTWLERDAKEQEEAAAKTSDTAATNSSTSKMLVNNNTDADESGVHEQRSGVKLVISKKKGSIFKSRALVNDQTDVGGKKRHVYKHTWDAENGEPSAATAPKNQPPNNLTSAEAIYADFDDGDEDSNQSALPKMTRVIKPVAGRLEPEQVTSVKIDRKAKEYYTVVRNVKTAHQIQEIGEHQEMDDDVEYILDALQPHNPIPTRCLSALQLASKCMTTAFRMHVRPHGTVTKFFRALRDSKNDLSLGLCTATIMFVLSQDTLNMDLDRDSLELLMNLLEVDARHSPNDLANFERSKAKVRELCEEIKSQGKAVHLNLDAISVGTLAMETLLSLTSKRAGEWFKEELRELGGIEHIIKTICECCRQISDYVVSWTEPLLDKLRTIERCLRVLENVSQANEANQKYILSYDNGHAIDVLCKLYKLCDSEIPLYPTTAATPKDNPGVVLREALLPLLKVLINLTHPFDTSAMGSAFLGQREGIIDTSLHILLQAPNYIPDLCIFELSVMVLLLLINLTMHTIPNRTLIMKSHAPSDFGNQFDKVPAIKALVEYFCKCEEYARLVEKNADALLEKPNDSKAKQDEVSETVNNLLQKAGHHMEHTLKASYTGLLLGHLISDSEDNEKIIRAYMKDENFKEVIAILEKYYTFLNLTASYEASVMAHIKSTRDIIDKFKQCDSTHSSRCDGEAKEDVASSHHQQPSTSTATNGGGSRNPPRVYKTYSQR